ncbi:MAG: 50S ribosomal protein L13 [Candidatus Aenigmarchaeota archaeon]|nr:50S ribosomal protein L13 [Candidatus Aenigmarchaeota archaeon]
MEVINAEGYILGRLATEVAVKALKGEEITIVNAEKAVISGRREVIFKRYLERRQRGTPQHGPFFPSSSDMIVRRAIRGMVSYKTERGREAYGKVNVISGIPEEYKNKEMKKNNQVEKLKCEFILVSELSKYLGDKNNE